MNNSTIATGNKNYSLGLSVAPFAPHRKYLQWELYVSTFNESQTSLGRKVGGDTVINRIGYKIDYREQFRKSKVVSIDAVPLQLRYNLNSFIGFGAGAMLSANLRTTNELIQDAYLQGTNGQSLIINSIQKEENQNFDQWKTTLFADIQLGRVRVGPSLGIRYLHSLNIKDRRLSTYLAWKF